MAKVVPLLRALNAMIIQYRNRFVRVHKSGPQVMTRYCLKSWMTTLFCNTFIQEDGALDVGHQTSFIVSDQRRRTLNTEFCSPSEFRNLDLLRHFCFLNDYFSIIIKANILDIRKQMEQSLYISIIFDNFMITRLEAPSRVPLLSYQLIRQVSLHRRTALLSISSRTSD